MPTGYTSDLAQGKPVTFQQFMAQCARGLGFIVSMRAAPWDAPLPEKIEPSDWHISKIDAAKQKIEMLATLSDKACENEADKAFDEEVASWDRIINDKLAQRERYDAMIAQVTDWDAPPLLQCLKDFMLQQLKTSVEHDCNISYYPAPKRMTGPEWKNETFKQAARDLSYHLEEHDKEVARAAERDEMLQALRVELAKLPT